MIRPVHRIGNIKNPQLNEFQELKFLGIIIDSKLKWKEHLNVIKSKVSVFIGKVFRMRCCLNVNCIRQIYLNLIYPHFL